MTTVRTDEESKDFEQRMDALEGESKKRFMLHYNFPNFSTGETGRIGAPGRREIGHHAVTPAGLGIGWKQAKRCSGDSAGVSRGFSR